MNDLTKVSAADSANYFSNRNALVHLGHSRGLSCGFCKLLLKQIESFNEKISKVSAADSANYFSNYILASVLDAVLVSAADSANYFSNHVIVARDGEVLSQLRILQTTSQTILR